MSEKLQWYLFYGVDGWGVSKEEVVELPESLNGVKREKIEFAEELFQGKKSSADEPEQGVLFAEFDLDEEKVLPMGFGACYYCQVFLNGEVILDRSEEGNKPYFPPAPDNFIVPGHCRKGRNLLAVFLRSAPGDVMRLAFRIFEDYQWQKTVPSIENYSSLLDMPSYPAEKTPEREYAVHLIQNGVLMMRNTVFNPYVDSRMNEEEAEEAVRKYPILYFYEKALDRIKKEVTESSPRENEVFLWLLYNMGYVIKSSAGTFGIDLNHRRAAEFAPLIDFSLTTHNHSDHQDQALFKALVQQKKKVITNFYPAPGFHRPPAELEINGIRIITQENDHNPTLQKFVTSYYITLPEGCTIFATGDSRDVNQLDPQGKVDIFIPHPRVGLSVPAAVEKFTPGSVLYSHMLEMRHTPPTPWYAVPYSLLKEERRRVEETGCAALAPLWGEKLVWNTQLKGFV